MPPPAPPRDGDRTSCRTRVTARAGVRRAGCDARHPSRAPLSARRAFQARRSWRAGVSAAPCTHAHARTRRLSAGARKTAATLETWAPSSFGRVSLGCANFVTRRPGRASTAGNQVADHAMPACHTLCTHASTRPTIHTKRIATHGSSVSHRCEPSGPHSSAHCPPWFARQQRQQAARRHDRRATGFASAATHGANNDGCELQLAGPERKSGAGDRWRLRLGLRVRSRACVARRQVRKQILVVA